MAGKNRKDNNSKKIEANKAKEPAVSTNEIHDEEFNSGFSNYLKSSQGEKKNHLNLNKNNKFLSPRNGNAKIVRHHELISRFSNNGLATH